MRLYGTGRWVADFPKRVPSAVRAPEPPRWPVHNIRLDVLPGDQGAIGRAKRMLKCPLLFGSINLPQAVNAGIQGGGCSDVSSVAGELGERNGFRSLTDREGKRAVFVQPRAY